MYISLQHLYFQENCKSDGAKLIEIEDSAEENLIDDGPLYGIFVCFECVTAKSTYMFFVKLTSGKTQLMCFISTPIYMPS